MPELHFQKATYGSGVAGFRCDPDTVSLPFLRAGRTTLAALATAITRGAAARSEMRSIEGATGPAPRRSPPYEPNRHHRRTVTVTKWTDRGLLCTTRSDGETLSRNVVRRRFSVQHIPLDERNSHVEHQERPSGNPAIPAPAIAPRSPTSPRGHTLPLGVPALCRNERLHPASTRRGIY